jgi:arylsulfatase A-like enzyme
MGQHFDFVTQPKVDYPEGAYLADWLTDRSLAFIEKHRQKPFFLCLHHFAVHSPHQAKPDLIAKFKGKPPAGGHRDPTYAAMLASVDESVGRMLARLDELKLAENTLVIFTSDNGGVGGYVEAGVKTKEGITSNAPLHGGKGMLYEGGVRVPWIARWPGNVKPGTTCDVPVISIDLFPTLLHLAGAQPAGDQLLDGVTLKPLLLGGRSLERTAIYWHFPGYLGAGKDGWRTTPAGAVRAGDWKLIEFFETGRARLFNLKDDVGEKVDLSEKMPEKARELREMLTAWRAHVKAPMPKARK